MGDLSPSSGEGKAEASDTDTTDVLTLSEGLLTQRDIVTSLSKLLKSAKESKVLCETFLCMRLCFVSVNVMNILCMRTRVCVCVYVHLCLCVTICVCVLSSKFMLDLV